jgi:hypothetical protein
MEQDVRTREKRLLTFGHDLLKYGFGAAAGQGACAGPKPFFDGNDNGVNGNK